MTLWFEVDDHGIRSMERCDVVVESWHELLAPGEGQILQIQRADSQTPRFKKYRKPCFNGGAEGDCSSVCGHGCRHKDRCLCPSCFNDDPDERAHNEGAVSFPVHGPLLLPSWDAMMGGDFGIVPALFGQAAEEEGECQNSYSYSIYLTLPTAALFWTQCWKHHNPSLGVAWGEGVGTDVVFALGGPSNI